MAKDQAARRSEQADLRRRHTRRRARAAAAEAGFGIERLEDRRLLAITVTSDNLSQYKFGADYLFADATSIDVSPGVVIDAGGGNITLAAPAISIGAGAKLLSKGTAGATDGAITLKAANQTTTAPLSLINQFYANFASAGGQYATIDIGKGAQIQGGAVTLDVVSGDALPQWWQDAVGTPIAGVLLKQATNTLNHILALPISIVIKQPESRLSVAENVAITGSGSVDLHSQAVAQADARARWSVVADAIQKATNASTGYGFAAGVAYSDVRSNVSLASGVTVTSTGGDVSLQSTIVNSTTMKARVYLNQGVNPTNPDNVAFSAAVNIQNSTSTVNLAAGSTIHAANAVEVRATGTDTNIARPKTSSYKDGLVGITAGVAIGTSIVEVFANGTIRADRAVAPATLVFDPATTVDFAADTIVLPADTEFKTGDAVVYQARGGAAIPGLDDGSTYYAIVDAVRRIRLARTPADALATTPVSIQLGPGFPTIAGAGSKGRLPIVGVAADLADTIDLDAATWPDGSAIIDGETITYAGIAGRFLGRNDAAGQFVAPLANGSYRIRVLERDAGSSTTSIQLLDVGDSTNTPIDLNDSAHFVTANGIWLRVNEFDADLEQVNFTFPAAEAGVTAPPPNQGPTLLSLPNGASLRYVEGFRGTVPKLVNGTTYYAIVDPESRGIVRLAATANQAEAADPAIQSACPSLSYSVPAEKEGDPPAIRTVEIDGVDGPTTFVFDGDPGIADGTAVIYSAVMGKPIGGLVDGTEYYAYRQANPYFDATLPKFLYQLRATAGTSAPPILFDQSQTMETAAGMRLPMEAIDTDARLVAVTLPLAPVPTADSTQLLGGTIAVSTVPAGSALLSTTGTGGSFLLQLQDGDSVVDLGTVPWNATAVEVAEVINSAGRLGISVSRAIGNGTRQSPWLLVGSGMTSLRFDPTGITGGSVYGEFTQEGLRAISTTATAGLFTLSVDTGAATGTTGSLSPHATAAAVAAALGSLPGVQATARFGTGSAASPWLVDIRRQPLSTGDTVVFHDAFGAETLGILAGRTYYAVVRPSTDQIRPGAVILGLAASSSAALASDPQMVSLDTSIQFEAITAETMLGRAHGLAPSLAGSITISASLTARDAGLSAAKNGGQPSFRDLMRGDMALSVGPKYLLGVMITAGASFLSKDYKTAAKAAVNNNLGNQQIAGNGSASASDMFGLSAAFSYLQGTRTVRTIIGDQANLITPGSIVVDSGLVEKFRTEVQADLAKPKKTAVAVALAVNVAFIDTVSQTIVRSNARLTGGDGVTINAGSVYPWFNRVVDGTATGILPELQQTFFVGADFASLAKGMIKSLRLPLDLWRVRDGFHETEASAGGQQKNFLNPKAGPNLDAVVGTAIAGALQLFWLDNRCESIVEDGVQINQDRSVLGSNLQPVKVTAGSSLMQFTVPFLSKSVGASVGNADGGAGFAVSYFAVGDTTRAMIGGTNSLQDATGVQAAAARGDVSALGPTRIAFGDGGLLVNAEHWGVMFVMAWGGVSATDWGISGMASVIDGRTTPERVEAAITTPAVGVEIARRPGTRGRVVVNGADNSYLIPIAGTSSKGAEKIVGVATAIALLDRTVSARIGELPASEATQVGGITIAVAGDVSVDATAAGAIVPTAVAGSKKTSKNTFDAVSRWDDDMMAAFLASRLTPTRVGIGASGAVAIANVDDAVVATVNHAGRMATDRPATLAVGAANTSIVMANSGGLAIRTAAGEEKVSMGLSGAVSLIVAASTVEASLRRATVDGFALDVSAENSRLVGTAAASGAGGAVGGAGSMTVNFAGSVAINSLTTRTLALLDGVKGTGLRGARVVATTDDTIWTVAGSFVANVSSILVRTGANGLSGADNGRSLAVGASVAIVKVTAETKATISKTDVSFSQGNLDVKATESSLVITASGGGSYVSTGGTVDAVLSTRNNAGSAVAGMVGIVSFDPTVEASITDSTVTMGDTGGDVSVLATTALLLATASGSFVVNRDGNGTLSASIGAAVTVVNSKAGSSSRVGRSKVTTPKGSVRVRSTYGNPSAAAWTALDPVVKQLNMPEAGGAAVWSFAIGAVAADSTLTAAASVNLTSLGISQSSTIADDSSVMAPAGSVDVSATNDAKIRTVAGSIATTAFTKDKSTLSAGAAILITTMSGATNASISSSSVTAGFDAAVAESGRVAVAAAERADILTIAASGVVSGQNALSTALVFNDLTGRVVSATITGTAAKRSAVSASKAVAVAAREETNLTAVSGQVAIPTSTSAAVSAGAAGSVNTLGVDVTAAIENATALCAGGEVTVEGVSGGTINAWAVGVSGALAGNSGGSLLGSLPVAFVGAGSFALNTVVRHTTAAVRNKASVTSRALAVDALDAGGIFAVAGALAAGVGSKTVSLAAGVSVAVNEIGTEASRGTVQALLDDATIATTGGNVAVTATAKPAVTSWTIAGTGQVSKGDAAAVGLAGAGASNTNRLAVDTLAAITSAASVTTDRAVTVTASDLSALDSNAGGAALGITLGSSAAVGVTAGAARNVVTVTNTVRAAVELSSIGAGGDVLVAATSKQSIGALAFGVGVNVAGAGAGGVSAAGSGGIVSATLATSTTAEVLSADVTAGTGGAGSVALRALDTPTVLTRAGAGSLSAAYGNGGAVALAPGVVIADTAIGNTVAARIGTAGGSTRLPDVNAMGTGSIDVDAQSAAAIDSLGVAVAFSASFSPSFLALAVAVSFARVTVEVGNTVTAEIASGTVGGSDIAISAGGRQTITNTVGVGAGAFSVAGASVGLSKAKATVADTILARIGTATVASRSGDITVAAGAGSTLDTRSVATAATIALGGSGTSGEASSQDTSRITATVDTGAALTAATGSVNVLVGGVVGDGGSVGYGRVAAQSDGGSLGLITVGQVSAKADHSQTRLATVGDNISLAGVGGLKIDARSNPTVKAQSFAVDVGGIAVQLNESVATSGGSTKAVVGSSVTLPAVVFVTAVGGTTFDVGQSGGAGGFAWGYGNNAATATAKAVVEATLGDFAVAAPGKRVDRLDVKAIQIDASNVAASNGLGAGIGIATVSATLNDTTSTRATIGKVGEADGSRPLDVGTLNVSASRSQVYSTTAKSYFGGGIAGGRPLATFSTTADARAVVAAGATIFSSGIVTLASSNTILRTTSGHSAVVSGGGVVSSAGDSSTGGSTVTIDTGSRVLIGDGVRITSGMSRLAPGGINILPESNVFIEESVGTWSGGVFSFGGLASKTTATVATKVEIGSDVALSTRGDLAIGTATRVTATESVVGVSGGATAQVAFNATAEVAVNQQIVFGSQARIAADGEVRITAGEDPANVAPTGIRVGAVVNGETGGAVTFISVVAKAKLANTSSVVFGAGADVGSGGDMHITAETGRPSVTSDGKVTYYDLEALWDWITGGENVKRATDTPQQKNTSTVTLAGTFAAGSLGNVALAIPAGFSSGSLVGTPAMLLGLPVAATFDDTFDSQAFVAAHFGDAGAQLAAAVPAAGKGVRVGPLYASGGNLTVRGDLLGGTATLVANQAHVAITNASPHHLVLDTVAIANTPAGAITLLDGSGKDVGRPSGWGLSADSTAPSILINQTYPESLAGSAFGPAVFLTNAARNPRGDVSITNARGSLGVIGTIAARSFDVAVPGGTAVFYVKGAVHAGGSPATAQTIPALAAVDANLFGDIGLLLANYGPATRTRDNTTNRLFSADTVASATGSTSIDARQIAIFADTININGDMLVGSAATPNQSVVVPAALQAELAQYRSDFLAGRQASPLYSIPAAKLGTKAAGDAILGVTFNAQTGQIVVDPADLAGGTRLTLIGKIINSSASAGVIKVRTDGGGVTIDNQTSFSLVTQAITTPGTGNSTTVRIVDMLKPEATRQTVYRSLGGEVLVSVGPATADLLAGTPTQRLDDSASVTYQPTIDARWTSTRTRLVGFGFGQPLYVSPWEYGGGNDPTAGSVVILNGSAVERTLETQYLVVPDTARFTVTDSMRADYPIGLSFTGSASAAVRIDSAASVLLREGIEAASVSIRAIVGSIDGVSGIDSIVAGSVSLAAAGSIGRAERPLSITATTLSAMSGAGDVSLAINRNLPTQAVTLGSVGASAGGVVSIEAGGDIWTAPADPSLPDDSTIRAGTIEIVSRQGSIGTPAAPLRTRVAPLGREAVTPLRLDATAAGNIHVSHLAGDLLVGTVTASVGNVSLRAGGSLYDAHTWTVTPNRQAQIDTALADLGVFDDEKAIADAVAVYQASVKNHYLRLWSIRNDGVVFDGRLQLRQEAYGKWSAITAAALGLPNGSWPGDQAVLDEAAKAYATEQGFFDRLIGGTWKSLAPFTTFDSEFVYQPTVAQREKLVADLGLDVRSMLRQVGVDMGESTRPWDPAVRVGSAVNVTGDTVTLVSRGGTIGKIGNAVTILGSELRRGSLSDTQRFELEMAGRRGDAVKVSGGFQFRVLRPVVVAASTRLDAEGSLGVAVAQPAGNLPIGTVLATSGDVDIAAAASIVNAPGTTGIATRTPADSAVVTTRLFSQAGSIGMANSPLTVTGGAVVAGALSGSVHVVAGTVIPEAPPQPQPDDASDPDQPRRQELERIDLTPGSLSTFVLGGTAPGAGSGFHDQVIVTGEAILNGTITVRLASGYLPQTGDEFVVMTYQSVRGTFTAGRGLFGLADDLWFEVVQTGDETTAGSVKLVARQFLPGASAALSVADTFGVDVAGTKNQIGELLNHKYFGLDIQVAFEGGFTYGDVDIHGRVALRYASRYDCYEMSISGQAAVGQAFAMSGEFLASVGIQEGGTVTSVAVVADDVELTTRLGGTTFAAHHGRIGLLVSDAGVAFEGSAGILAQLSSDLSLYADEFSVYYNPTEVDYSGVMFSLDTVSYEFGSLKSHTFGVEVADGEIIAGGFLRASGNFAINGFSQMIKLADGVELMSDVLTIGGVNRLRRGRRRHRVGGGREHHEC